MRRLIVPALATALLVCLAMPARADFSSVVRLMSEDTQLERVHVPFFGLARFAVRILEPEGIFDIRLAVFEGRSSIDPAELERAISRGLDPAWQPIVKAVDRRSDERSVIYARETPRGVRLLIVTHDGSDATVVETEISPEVFFEDVVEPQRMAERAGR